VSYENPTAYERRFNTMREYSSVESARPVVIYDEYLNDVNAPGYVHPKKRRKVFMRWLASIGWVVILFLSFLAITEWRAVCCWFQH
ncbi:MAG: hypothetical protein P8J32_03340, partial [bacterium]|nr:hypothetical protein [bacterium]